MIIARLSVYVCDYCKGELESKDYPEEWRKVETYERKQNENCKLINEYDCCKECLEKLRRIGI